ncbi:MAG: PepSY-associated TM helix domain-containing protein, partial [Bacteroidota bacterium]
MSKRTYNVFLDTHTVSGILISIGLYVIFLAGAFALFEENIDHWEANETLHAEYVALDYDRVLATVEAEGYHMHGRTLNISQFEGSISVFSQPLRDSSLSPSTLGTLADSVASGPINLKLSEANYEIQSPEAEAEHEMTLGHFLVDLHWFEQIPTVGPYLSGFIAVFFLFVSITGIIVHWKKILSFFFTFRLKGSIKNLWTDAHTALGVIGLPFQIMFAITGVLYALHGIMLIPYSVFGSEDQQAAMQAIFMPPSYEVEGMAAPTSINDFVARSMEEIPGDQIVWYRLELRNYLDQNAHLSYQMGTTAKDGFLNDATGVYRLSDGALIEQKTTSEFPTYQMAIVPFILRLHHGDYGGYFLKFTYFLLALLTCFVIISGVMIWLKARDNKKYEARRN